MTIFLEDSLHSLPCLQRGLLTLWCLRRIQDLLLQCKEGSTVQTQFCMESVATLGSTVFIQPQRGRNHFLWSLLLFFCLPHPVFWLSYLCQDQDPQARRSQALLFGVFTMFFGTSRHFCDAVEKHPWCGRGVNKCLPERGRSNQ